MRPTHSPRIGLFVAVIIFAWLRSAVAVEMAVRFDVGANGRTITNSEVLLVEKEQIRGAFAPIETMPRRFEASPGAEMGYVVRAPGFALKYGVLPTNFTGSVHVEMDPGATVELKIASHKPLPAELLPVVFPERFLEDVAFSMDARTSAGLLKFFDVKRAAASGNVFQFQATPGERFCVLIHHPGFLRGFISEPFIAKSHVELQLPIPAELQVSFNPTDLAGNERALVTVFKTFEAANASVRMVYEHQPGAVAGTWKDLAPGSYRIEGAAFKSEKERKRSKDIRKAKFQAAANAYVVLTSPLEQSRFRGECTVKLRVTNCEGAVLRGVPYELTYFDTNTVATISVAYGETSESGEIILRNVKNGTNAPQLFANINGVKFPIRFDQVSTNESRDLMLPPGPGDVAPKFEVKDLASGTARAFPGRRFTVLDFWAVWCGPCQEPMSALNETLMRKAAAWSNRVDVVAVSFDHSKDDVIRRVTERDWRRIPQYWEPRGFESDLAKLYQVVLLPTSLLIDANGRILWRGDPRDFAIETTVDDLLRGNARADDLISWQRAR